MNIRDQWIETLRGNDRGNGVVRVNDDWRSTESHCLVGELYKVQSASWPVRKRTVSDRVRAALWTVRHRIDLAMHGCHCEEEY